MPPGRVPAGGEGDLAAGAELRDDPGADGAAHRDQRPLAAAMWATN